MTAGNLMLLAMVLPLLGAICIIALGEQRANAREAMTLLTASTLAVIVWSLVPGVLAGERPAVVVGEFVPGLSFAFALEPMGMTFAALAATLWIVNSIYSIGYMRANKERNQTRFYALFAVALAAVMGIAFAGNLLTLFLCYEILTLSTYPLVAHKGDAATLQSARVYLGVLLATSIGLLLPAIVWTYAVAGTGEFRMDGILARQARRPLAGIAAGAVHVWHRQGRNDARASLAAGRHGGADTGQRSAACRSGGQGGCVYRHESAGLRIWY